MVFSSLIFLYGFLILSLLTYWMGRGETYRNWNLIAFSLLFYAWGEPVWVILLLISSSTDYVLGRVIERHLKTSKARLALALSLTINLGLLASFKYAGFFAETLNLMLPWELPIPQQTLPIGISFYTFQTISYAVDVYRGKVKAQQSYSKFLLFVSLYHQLVAGPIVRYEEIAAEIEKRQVTLEGFASGITRFSVGLAKKVCIANIAGEIAARYLDADHSGLAMSEAWLGMVMFSVQIYFDFSGYSDMAIGLGRMYGFTYGENFRYPYIAKTATEFWRRWHISLGSFFRDYLYIPLGGKRHWPYRNLFIVWFLTGLWHGASWNFVLWGLFFGLFITIEKAGLASLLKRLPSFVGHTYLIFIVVVSWVLFYFVDLDKAVSLFGVMFGFGDQSMWSFETNLVLMENSVWLVLVVLGCTPGPARLTLSLYDRWTNGRLAPLGWTLRVFFNLCLIGASTIMLSTGGYNPFLYFRF